jgi:hypothetical protein
MSKGVGVKDHPVRAWVRRVDSCEPKAKVAKPDRARKR